MKMLKLTISLCLISLAGFSSDDTNFITGHIVKADGSRLTTLVKIPEAAEDDAILFRNTDTGEEVEVESKELRSITVNIEGETIEFVNTNFISRTKKVSDKSVWLKTESWGEITMYSGNFGKDNNQIYLIKRESDQLPVEFTHANFKTSLIAYISDYNYLAKDLESGKYLFSDLKVILDEYNAWKSFE